MVKRTDKKWGVRLPGNADVGDFAGRIVFTVFLLQEAVSRRDDREKTRSKFLLRVPARLRIASPQPLLVSSQPNHLRTSTSAASQAPHGIPTPRYRHRLLRMTYSMRGC